METMGITGALQGLHWDNVKENGNFREYMGIR